MGSGADTVEIAVFNSGKDYKIRYENKYLFTREKMKQVTSFKCGKRTNTTNTPQSQENIIFNQLTSGFTFIIFFKTFFFPAYSLITSSYDSNYITFFKMQKEEIIYDIL